MLATELLLSYGCLFHKSWCRPHPLIAGSGYKSNSTTETNETNITTLQPETPTPETTTEPNVFDSSIFKSLFFCLIRGRSQTTLTSRGDSPKMLKVENVKKKAKNL